MASKPKTAAAAETADPAPTKAKPGAPCRSSRSFSLPSASWRWAGEASAPTNSSPPPRDSHDTAPATKPTVFVDLPEVLVNLSNTGSDRTQYLRVKVVLELPDQLLMQQIQPVMPRVLDTFQTYLRELRPTDLDGSSGLYRLKEELTRRVNAAIAPNKVSAVLFKEIVVQ